jgi:hypothetical protein
VRRQKGTAAPQSLLLIRAQCVPPPHTSPQTHDGHAGRKVLRAGAAADQRALEQPGTLSQPNSIRPPIRSPIRSLTPPQIRERWINFLAPGLIRGPFTAAEDAALVDAHKALGNRWTAIGRRLNRSDSDVKNRFNAASRRVAKKGDAQSLLRAYIASLPPKPAKKGRRPAVRAEAQCAAAAGGSAAAAAVGLELGAAFSGFKPEPWLLDGGEMPPLGGADAALDMDWLLDLDEDALLRDFLSAPIEAQPAAAGEPQTAPPAPPTPVQPPPLPPPPPPPLDVAPASNGASLSRPGSPEHAASDQTSSAPPEAGESSGAAGCIDWAVGGADVEAGPMLEMAA